uniref:Uncharacterized protein n=1 Tax=Salmonella sp. TaxID=599 RepID=A0A482ETT9_SALSP|nr:hypothetical protein [Salmonella sp.]QBM91456.1 hypothetical protein NNIBIDOC_00127 [Salmonella sp.]
MVNANPCSRQNSSGVSTLQNILRSFPAIAANRKPVLTILIGMVFLLVVSYFTINTNPLVSQYYQSRHWGTLMDICILEKPSTGIWIAELVGSAVQLNAMGSRVNQTFIPLPRRFGINA